MLYHKNFYRFSIFVLSILSIGLSAMNPGEERIVLNLHDHYVLSTKYSPNGEFIASGSYDAKINILRAETGALYRTLEDNLKSGITSVAFSPDGNSIASACGVGRIIKIWDIETGICLKRLEGHEGTVHSLCYSPDGRSIVSAGQFATIKIWDIETERCLKTLQSHAGCIFSVDYSPDGRSIVSGSNDKKIRIWDVDTGDCLNILEGHNRCVFSVNYSPDGRNIVSGSQDCTIKIWNTANGNCVKTFLGHEDSIFSVNYSPNGRTISSGSFDKTIKIWDVETGDLIKTLAGHENRIFSVNYSPSGRNLVSGSYDKTIIIWKNVVMPQPVMHEEGGEVDQPVRNEECVICGLTSQELDAEERYHTSCCHQFICRDDAERMEQEAQELYFNLRDPEWRRQYAASPDFTGWPRAHEHARCPFCRHYPLEVLWQEGQQECAICLDDKVRGAFVKLHCEHEFCKDCLMRMIDLTIRERTTANLICPNPECVAKMDEQDVRNITDNDRRRRGAFAEITAQEWIAEQPNAKHCPTPNCQFVFLAHGHFPEMVRCPQCAGEYCSNCLHLHNMQVTCREAEENRRLARDELENEEWLRRNTKLCPRCGARVQRDGGCLYVRCRCGHGFCFNCLGAHHVSVGGCHAPAAASQG